MRLLLILVTDMNQGQMGHITTNTATGQWMLKFGPQNIANSMTLTSLIRIRDASRGLTTAEQLAALLAEVPVPAGSQDGECLNWVIRAVQHLAARGVVTLTSAEGLREEFKQFCAGNRSFARRDKFPNVKVSQFCV